MNMGIRIGRGPVRCHGKHVKKLAIKDLAEQTGVAAGTIRMWEQRYGFPEPARTAAGYRVYTEQDVVALRRVVAYRSRGLSVPAALDRARSLEGETDSPSIFAALASGDTPVRPQKLRRQTLIALSRAIEEEAMARAAGPVVIGAFQDESNYRAVEHRYRRLAHVADAVGVFATFDGPRFGNEDEPAEIPITKADALGHEWAVIVDAPGYAACLVGWETPSRGDERIFEAVWTMDPAVVRRAARVGAAIAAHSAPEWSERLLSILADRPLAVEAPAPGLTALSNRVIGYLDAMAAESDRRPA
jgi:DICT domain-containing protein